MSHSASARERRGPRQGHRRGTASAAPHGAGDAARADARARRGAEHSWSNWARRWTPLALALVLGLVGARLLAPPQTDAEVTAAVRAFYDFGSLLAQPVNWWRHGDRLHGGTFHTCLNVPVGSRAAYGGRACSGEYLDDVLIARVRPLVRGGMPLVGGGGTPPATWPTPDALAPPACAAWERQTAEDEGTPGPVGPLILDAGCGLGGTMLRWHTQAAAEGVAKGGTLSAVSTRPTGRWVGLTLSSVQTQLACEAIAARGASGQVSVVMRSYDDPLPTPFRGGPAPAGAAELHVSAPWRPRVGPPSCGFAVQSATPPLHGCYDAVVALESLRHAANATESLGRLVSALRPRGVLGVVDDLALATAGGAAAAGLAASEAVMDAFVTYWHARGARRTIETWQAELEALGMEVLVSERLTGADAGSGSVGREVWLHAGMALGAAAHNVLGGVSWLLGRPAGLEGLREAAGMLSGGMARQLLYADGRLSLHMLVARKRSS